MPTKPIEQRHPVREFRELLVSKGVTPERVTHLLTLANRYQVLMTIACNNDVGDKFAQEEYELENALRAYVGGPITAVNLSGDPRGFTVKLILQSGEYNSWGGKESGYGVPTRERSVEEIDRAAKMDPKHWL